MFAVSWHDRESVSNFVKDVKDPVFLERIREYLIQLGAEDLVFLTDANDGRTALRV